MKTMFLLGQINSSPAPIQTDEIRLQVRQSTQEKLSDLNIRPEYIFGWRVAQNTPEMKNKKKREKVNDTNVRKKKNADENRNFADNKQTTGHPDCDYVLH